MAADNADDFFLEMKDWSERKLRLFSAYLVGFVRILSGKGKIYYVDGFAGCGVYKDGAKGSPLRAAELAHGFAVLRLPFERSAKA